MKPMTKVPDLKFEPDWRRLKFVIEQSGMSEKEFAEFVDLPDPSIITHIRYAQCGIDEQLARKINYKYSQYSVEWLLGQPEIPKIAKMLPEVWKEEQIKEMAFIHAKDRFNSLADIVEKQIIRTIPSQDELREERLDHLADDIIEMNSLYEIMKECAAPQDIDNLSKLRDRYDDLYEAAVKLDADLP